MLGMGSGTIRIASCGCRNGVASRKEPAIAKGLGGLSKFIKQASKPD